MRPVPVLDRTRAAIALGLTIALGVASRRIHLDVFLWDKSLGDALYTVMLYFIGALVRPASTPRQLGVAAIGLSLVIEAFQLTGIPLRLPRVLQIAVGTIFSWHDVVCYLVGGLVVTLVHERLAKRAAAAG